MFLRGNVGDEDVGEKPHLTDKRMSQRRGSCSYFTVSRWTGMEQEEDAVARGMMQWQEGGCSGRRRMQWQRVDAVACVRREGAVVGGRVQWPVSGERVLWQEG